MLKWRFEKPKKPEKRVDDPEFLIYTKKEIIWMIITIIIASFISFIPVIPNDNPIKVISTLTIFSIIVLVSVTAKKIAANHYAIKIEHRMYEWSRWGYYKRSALKRPFPMGLAFPFILGMFSLGYIKPFTFLQFDAVNYPEKRILKAHGQRRAERKEVINEEDLGYTSAIGFYSLLVLALIGGILSYKFNNFFGADLAKYAVYFGLWNLIPYGELDGNKLFFGVTIGWIFITFLYLIGLILVLI